MRLYKILIIHRPTGYCWNEYFKGTNKNSAIDRAIEYLKDRNYPCDSYDLYPVSFMYYSSGKWVELLDGSRVERIKKSYLQHEKRHKYVKPCESTIQADANDAVGRKDDRNVCN